MNTQPDHLRLLGRHVRRLRRERDLSQEDLALAAEISRSNVSELERGGREPKFLTLLQIARALGVPPSTLFAPFDERDTGS